MKTKKRCQFIEEEASEGYSSEDDNDSNFEINKIEAEKQYKQLLERRKKQQRSLEKKLEKLMNEDNLDEYSQKDSDDVVDENQQNQDDSFQDGPKSQDPKIWRFKCGKSLNLAERVLQIQKFLPKESPIISIFFNPNLKGFVFFESYFDKDIKIVMKEIMYGEPIYVQPEDCYSLLEIKRNMNIQIGQWIRFRNHRNYGTDLGKVLRVNRITNLAIIKVIKRNKKGQKEPISWQRTKEQTIEKKYDSEFIYSDIEKEYKCAKLDGFELLKCNLKNLEHNITITDEELQMFYPDVMDRKILVQQAKRELLRRVDVQFKEGQKVRLIGEDDLNQGPKFKIIKIYDDQMIELMCKKDNREYTYLVHASEIRLAFKLYQEVKVTDGPHKGDVGVIICIKQGYVVLSTLYGTIKVPHSVIQFGHKCYQTINSLVKFGNSDFQIGCIIEQKLQSAIVLDINNQIQEISIQKIETITANRVEINQYGDTFKENDNVRINGGLYTGKIGMIKHCFNGKIYLFNHEFPHSIILENIENCSLVFSKLQNQKQNDKKIFMGQICIIKQGQFKDYKGQVISLKQGYLVVQLQLNNQKINIKESEIMLL